MIEELKAVLSRVRTSDGRISQDDHYASIFLRDHGQALVEALADAERYRWLRDEAGETYDGPYIAGKKAKPFAGEGWLTGEDADTSIDTARSKTVDGGGV